MAEHSQNSSSPNGDRELTRLVDLADQAARRSSFNPSPLDYQSRRSMQAPGAGVSSSNGNGVKAASSGLRMLRPRALQNVLKETVSAGVKGSMVLNEDGSLLSHCGTSEASTRITGAIASNIYTAYQRSGQAMLKGADANTILIVNDDGAIVIRRVASKLICLFADKSVPIGMLRAKADALHDCLQEPLTALGP
eukprot:scpid85871/ scgid14794/ Ragulator complex protein LAMTOR2; Endosomal adaptor protein p14; Late endosomal/lysosomal Mp1-interacting protein; Late endosomal/lysosomal adaptor and MAPK and MTOR activator 2; Mitogen-activated protein-binding protein-interacting protein; Roadblock domain-containing protein 3 &gt; Ragulator complex protein LAMTOR2; Late endosomal/lysosomal adaptor and MAPK and MTOR activator 2